MIDLCSPALRSVFCNKYATIIVIGVSAFLLINNNVLADTTSKTEDDSSKPIDLGQVFENALKGSDNSDLSDERNSPPKRNPLQLPYCNPQVKEIESIK